LRCPYGLKLVGIAPLTLLEAYFYSKAVAENAFSRDEFESRYRMEPAMNIGDSTAAAMQM
jgi:hypothetical protein